MASAVAQQPLIAGATAKLPPGPRHPRILQALLWALRYPQFTRAAHARHGDTFTVRPGTSPPTVVTIDRDAIRRLLTGDPLRKRHGNDVLRPLVGDRSVLLLEPPDHLARRKLLLGPFHGERIAAYAALMEQLVDDELERWRPGMVLSMFPVAQRMTLEVILQAVLGVADARLRERLRELIDDTLGYPIGALRRRLQGRLGGPALDRHAPLRRLRDVAAVLGQLPAPAVMTYFPEFKQRTAWNFSTWRWWQLCDELAGLLDAQIAATRSDPQLAARGDILAMLVQARDEHGNGLGDEDLRDELFALIAAGHETTATAIAWGAELLAHHPDVAARAASGDDRYLDAVVKEVLRLRPPLPIGAGRVLDEPFAIGRHEIPPGVAILIDAWGLHHDASLYPQPERFDPERFLERSPAPYTWLPFGGGAHRCLGAGLAELEIRIALRGLVSRVRLAPVTRQPASPVRRGITLIPRGGGVVEVAGA